MARRNLAIADALDCMSRAAVARPAGISAYTREDLAAICKERSGKPSEE